MAYIGIAGWGFVLQILASCSGPVPSNLSSTSSPIPIQVSQCHANFLNGAEFSGKIGRSFESSQLFSNCDEAEIDYSGTLPTGLNLDRFDWKIKGVPENEGLNEISFRYVLNEAETTQIITIQIDSVLPKEFEYPVKKTKLIIGSSLSLKPSVSEQGITFSIQPNLPAGLSIDSVTGEIRGTPQIPQDEVSYIIKASLGAEVSTSSIAILIATSGPGNLAYPAAEVVMEVGAQASPVSPQYTARTQHSFEISPDLPVGLTFSAETGTIGGFPLAAQAPTKYIIKLSDVDGATTTELTIAVAADVLDTSSFEILSATLPRVQGWGSLVTIGDRAYLYGGAGSGWGGGGASHRYILSAPMSDLTNWQNDGQLLPQPMGWVGGVTVGEETFIYGSVFGSVEIFVSG